MESFNQPATKLSNNLVNQIILKDKIILKNRSGEVNEKAMKLNTTDEFFILNNEKPPNTLLQTPVCRICLESNNSQEDKLIKPCACKGSASTVHEQCIEKWLKLTNSTLKQARNRKCKLCLKSFVLNENKLQYIALFKLGAQFTST